MRWLQVVLLRLRAMLRRSAVERDMEAEMAEHLACETEELVRRGLPREEASRRAAATMGRIAAIQEDCRDARGVAWWDNLRQDATFAVRLLAKRRTYAAMALATVTLGIGSTSAVFSVVDAVLIRPLPYPQPERLISVEGIGMNGPFDAMRTRSRVADYAAHRGVRALNLSTDRNQPPDRVKGTEVSGNLFSVLGIRPVLGRVFAEPEDRAGAAPVVMLSHSFWTQRYGGRNDVIGRQLVLDEKAYEIAGVLPQGFAFPSAVVQVWIPMRLDPRSVGDYWGMGGTHFVARLRAGASLEAVRAELRSEVPRIRAMFPWRMPDQWGAELRVVELRDAMVADSRVRGWMLLAVVGLVLLIAVVNVANLTLGQTASRSRELALRMSLGAAPGRIARQLMTEALILAGAGGVLGVGLAYVEVAVLKSWLPSGTPRVDEIALDGRVLAFTAAVSVISGILFGLWPAWRARRQVAPGLEGARATAGPRSQRSDVVLVMTEAAFATILLVTSGLLLRSLWTMLNVDVGFRTESVVTAELSPSPSVANSSEKRAMLWDSVRTRLLAYPGVRSVAALNVLPLTPDVTAFAAALEDHPVPERQPQYVLWSTSVTPGHLDVLGVPLLQGRAFTDADGPNGELVVMVSRSTAKRFWPNGNAIGRRLKPVYDRRWRTIVGVVDDVKAYGIGGPPGWVHGEVYLPVAQSLEAAAPLAITARVEGDRVAFQKALATLVHEVCKGCAVGNVRAMEDVVSSAIQTPRSTAWMVAGFAMLALGMAAAGIYGVVNHRIVRRTTELGIRLALGASPFRLAALVVASSLGSVLTGIVVGLACSWYLAGFIRQVLFGVAPHDPISFLAAPAVLTIVAVTACVGPAIRAVRIDPARSLREA